MSQTAEAIDLADYTHSIGARIDGFFYRCLNRADYAMTWVSEGFGGLTGLDAVDFVDNRRSFSDLIHPEDRAGVDQAVAAGLASNGRWQIMYRLKRPQAGWRYVHETGGGARDPQTGETRFLDGVILEAEHMTELAEKLKSGQSAVTAINVSINAIFDALKMLRLLALNARIEAAHAREMGAGFSIVAQEMMSLANAGECAMRAIEGELGRLNDAIRL